MFWSVASGFFTVVTILMAAAVVYYFWRPVKKVAKSDDTTAEGWLICGIFIGFVGQLLDNIYWGTTWTNNFVAPGGFLDDWLFSHGVMFNMPFRQLAGTAAAYCHIKAIVRIDKKANNKFKIFMFTSATLGTAFSIWMLFFAR